jgi:hypothetical protein
VAGTRTIGIGLFLASFALVQSAEARFHLLDGHRRGRSLRSRLNAKLPQLDGIGVLQIKLPGGALGWGTAFVVHRGRRGRALVLTNKHVVDGLESVRASRGGDVKLVFRPGRRAEREARVVRTVASERLHDYALVEVKLPRGLRVSVLQLESDWRRTEGSAKLVSSGYDSPRWLTRPVQTIQVGRYKPDSEPTVVGEKGARVIVYTNSMSSLPGGSGRPVWNEHGKVVGINVGLPEPKPGQDAARDNLACQMADLPHILNDLRLQLESGRVPREARPMVRALLRRSNARSSDGSK